VAQRVGRGIALLFHDRGTRRGEWSAARPGRNLPPGKTRYPFYRRLGGPQGRSGRAENLVPTGISIPDRPARSQSLYRLSYPAHILQSINKLLSYNQLQKVARQSRLSVVKFRNVASRKDMTAYVTYDDIPTNYSKCTWVGVLTMRPKHDCIVKGSVTLSTQDGGTIPCLKQQAMKTQRRVNV